MGIYDGTEPIRLDEDKRAKFFALLEMESKNTEQPQTDDQLLAAMLDLWQKMTESKPNDRSEKDRRYAVAITKMQDVAVWFKMMVIDGFDPSV